MDNKQYEKESELIVTSTHSIRESKGSALGLEGNQALYIVGAAVTAFVIVFIGVLEHWGIVQIVPAFVLPFVFAYLYLYIFHIGKPPGYQSDLMSKLINGSNYDIRKQHHRKNPLYELKQRAKNGC